MINREARGPLMGPADGTEIGSGKIRRIKRVERPLTMNEQQELRERQLKLVPLWFEGKNQFRPIDNGNRALPTKTELDSAEKTPTNSSEDSRISEVMIAELFERKGLTQPYAMQKAGQAVREGNTGTSVREGYNLLQENGHMFIGSDVSDKLGGADVVLLISDEGEPTKASVFAIDVTMDRAVAPLKVARGIERVRQEPYKDGLNELYWYDSGIPERDEKTGHALRDKDTRKLITYKQGERFTEPKEGKKVGDKIPAINLAVYVPGEWVQKFKDPNTTAIEAHLIMKRLGGFALRQMKLELEVMAMRALGIIKVGIDRRDQMIDLDRSGVDILRDLKFLELRDKTVPPRYSLRAIRLGLAQMYSAELKLQENGRGMLAEDKRLLPDIMEGFSGFELPTKDELEELEDELSDAAE